MAAGRFYNAVWGPVEMSIPHEPFLDAFEEAAIVFFRAIIARELAHEFPLPIGQMAGCNHSHGHVKIASAACVKAG